MWGSGRGEGETQGARDKDRVSEPERKRWRHRGQEGGGKKGKEKMSRPAGRGAEETERVAKC